MRPCEGAQPRNRENPRYRRSVAVSRRQPERPRAIGVWARIGGSALVAGPVLGGLLVEPLGWRAIFWLNLPLAVVALALAVASRRPAGWGLLATGCGYPGAAALGSGIDEPAGWLCLAVAGTGMAVAVPGLVAGTTEALDQDRAGIASAINNTSRQVGGAIGVALIGGFGSLSSSLAISAAALLLGGTAALILMPSHSAARREQEGRGVLSKHSKASAASEF